ncbi:MAG TPA: copper transporter [Acidimicrobiales bacterium]|nr:copper transporter [Acidimicrobiales bacterium]
MALLAAFLLGAAVIAGAMWLRPPPPAPEPPAPEPVEPPVEVGALDPPTHEPPPTTVAPTTTTTAPPPPPARGQLIDALTARGWLEFDPDAADSPLPTWGARFVLVTDGDGAGAGADPVVLALIDGVAAATATPSTVLAGLTPDPPGDDTDDDTGDDATPEAAAAVRLVRADERLAARVSTVDHVLGFEGLAALVLALEDLDLPRVGHYGIAPSAGALLPPAQP